MAREAALISALVELADTVGEGSDPAEHSYVLAERCVELLDAAAGCVVLATEGGLDVAAATSRSSRLLAELQARSGQGPCIAAYERGAPVAAPDLAMSADEWPELAARAVELDYRSLLAQPLLFGDERLGAIQVLWAEPDGFDTQHLLFAKGLAAMASIGIAHERAVRAAHSQIHHLNRALEARAVVEQAKVLLAERLAADQGDAFDRLRRYARNRNQPLRDVAQRFLNGELTEDAFQPE